MLVMAIKMRIIRERCTVNEAYGNRAAGKASRPSPLYLDISHASLHRSTAERKRLKCSHYECPIVIPKSAWCFYFVVQRR